MHEYVIMTCVSYKQILTILLWRARWVWYKTLLGISSCLVCWDSCLEASTGLMPVLVIARVWDNNIYKRVFGQSQAVYSLRRIPASKIWMALKIMTWSIVQHSTWHVCLYKIPNYPIHAVLVSQRPNHDLDDHDSVKDNEDLSFYMQKEKLEDTHYPESGHFLWSTCHLNRLLECGMKVLNCGKCQVYFLCYFGQDKDPAPLLFSWKCWWR